MLFVTAKRGGVASTLMGKRDILARLLVVLQLLRYNNEANVLKCALVDGRVLCLFVAV